MFGGVLCTKCTHANIYDFEIHALKIVVQLKLLYTKTQLLFYWYLLILIQTEQTQNGVRK